MLLTLVTVVEVAEALVVVWGCGEMLKLEALREGQAIGREAHSNNTTTVTDTH